MSHLYNIGMRQVQYIKSVNCEKDISDTETRYRGRSIRFYNNKYGCKGKQRPDIEAGVSGSIITNMAIRINRDRIERQTYPVL